MQKSYHAMWKKLAVTCHLLQIIKIFSNQKPCQTQDYKPH
jgi:hypothetical protein